MSRFESIFDDKKQHIPFRLLTEELDLGNKETESTTVIRDTGIHDLKSKKMSITVFRPTNETVRDST